MNQDDIKRLNLIKYNVNLNENYETIDSRSNHTIYLKLNKDNSVHCPCCGSDNLKIKGYKPITIKYATILENKITIILYLQISRLSSLEIRSA